MQIPRPTKARSLVFTVPIKRKIKGSLLYVPSPRRGSFSGAQECWMITQGPEVKEVISSGTLCYVHDGFEFEDINIDGLWEHYKETGEFKKLKELVEECDGEVAVKLVPESALLAVECD